MSSVVAVAMVPLIGVVVPVIVVVVIEGGSSQWFTWEGWDTNAWCRREKGDQR
jgi:hypothetical protein